MQSPVLVACSHGTDDAQGRRVVADLARAVRVARPDLDVRETFVDVQEPAVADVVAQVLTESAGASAVVVPLLLSAGYHVHVDIAEAVAPFPGRAAVAGPMGPDPRLVDLLARRLGEVGLGSQDAVVLAAAGSSDPRSAAAVQEVARALSTAIGAPVRVGYGSVARPRVPEVVAAARADGAVRVVVAAYLLAPGFFLSRIVESGADAVTAPLAPDPVLTDLVIDRYTAAAATLAPVASAP